MDKQLCVWIDSDLKDALVERAQRENATLRDIVAGILWVDVTRERSEVVHQQIFPVLRELIQTEVRNSLAQLRLEVREDMHVEILEGVRDLARISESRLARLLTRIIRDVSVLHQFLYALVARMVNAEFARNAYADAQEKAAQELAVRPPAKKAAAQ